MSHYCLPTQAASPGPEAVDVITDGYPAGMSRGTHTSIIWNLESNNVLLLI